MEYRESVDNPPYFVPRFTAPVQAPAPYIGRKGTLGREIVERLRAEREKGESE